MAGSLFYIALWTVERLAKADPVLSPRTNRGFAQA
jgi:hypothetical protein